MPAVGRQAYRHYGSGAELRPFLGPAVTIDPVEVGDRVQRASPPMPINVLISEFDHSFTHRELVSTLFCSLNKHTQREELTAFVTARTAAHLSLDARRAAIMGVKGEPSFYTGVSLFVD